MILMGLLEAQILRMWMQFWPDSFHIQPLLLCWLKGLKTSSLLKMVSTREHFAVINFYNVPCTLNSVWINLFQLLGWNTIRDDYCLSMVFEKQSILNGTHTFVCQKLMKKQTNQQQGIIVQYDDASLYTSVQISDFRVFKCWFDMYSHHWACSNFFTSANL